MSWATVPICERCWVEKNTSSDGTVRVPCRLKDSDCSACHFCELPTWAGIFVRAEVTPEEKARIDP